MKVLLIAAILVLLSGCTGAPAAAPEPQDLDDSPLAASSPMSRPASGTTRPPSSSNASAQTPTANETPPEPQPWRLDRDGWASLESAILRPGSPIGDNDDPSCTANFIFTNPDGTKAYIGTAAHCLDIPDDDPSCDDEFPALTDDTLAYAYAPSGGLPLTARPDGIEVGRFVYSSFRAMQEAGDDRPFWCAYNDFALIELNDNGTRMANPAMWHYGGPTQLAVDEASNGDIVHTFGGSARHAHPLDSTRPRDGIITPNQSELTGGGWGLTFHAVFPGTCMAGDSGSPVTTASGEALGVLTRGLGAIVSPSCVMAYLAPMLAYMAAHGGPEVVLATAATL